MKRVLIILVLASLPQIGWAQQAGAVERIAQLLEQEMHSFELAGSGLERQSIRILDSSQLSIPEASFRLAGLRRTSRDGYLATVRCSSAAECLPFLVAFRCRRPAGAMADRLKAVDHAKAGPRAKRSAAVHTGETARLELTLTGANLSFPVICLEEGGVGEMIRTRAIAGNRIFVAMVTGPRQLRGVEDSR
jgi:hypothetical protein